MYEICVHKSALMQSMTRVIARGSYRYFQGVVRAPNVFSLIDKFERRYSTHLNDNQRAYRRKLGIGNARLYLHPLRTLKGRKNLELQWVVLLTEGDHPAFGQEKVFDLRDKKTRLVFDERFEAVRHTKDGKQIWSWQLVPETFEREKEKITQAIRLHRPDTEIMRIVMGWYHLPGFKKIRDQVGHFTAVARAEWRRSRRGNTACPAVKSRAGGYLRLMPRHEVPLNYVVDRMLAGETPFADGWMKTNKELRQKSGKKDEALRARMAAAAKKKPSELVRVEAEDAAIIALFEKGSVPITLLETDQKCERKMAHACPKTTGWAWQPGEREWLESWFQILDPRSKEERCEEAIFEANIQVKREFEDVQSDPLAEMEQGILPLFRHSQPPLRQQDHSYPNYATRAPSSDGHLETLETANYVSSTNAAGDCSRFPKSL